VEEKLGAGEMGVVYRTTDTGATHEFCYRAAVLHLNAWGSRLAAGDLGPAVERLDRRIGEFQIPR
jgi:hypothetical protein